MPVEQLPKPPAAARTTSKFVKYDEYIDQQVEATRRVVKVVELATAGILLLGGVLVFLLAAAVLEHWIIPGGFTVLERAILFAVLLAGVGYFCARRIFPLVIRRVNPVYAAHAIEQTGPTLKNSLVNLLLFRQKRSEISDAVFHTLEEQAAQRLSRVELDAAVDRSLLIRLGYVLLGIVAIGAAYKVFSPKDPITVARRVLMPWAEIVPASRVNINDVQPGRVTVSRGEYLDVSAAVRGIGDDDTVLLKYSTADGRAVDKSIVMRLAKGGLRFEGRLPQEQDPVSELGLAQDITYRIEAGDARTLDYPVKVVEAPSILVTRVEYDYPDYTGLVDHSADSLGDINAIEGTRITLHARANGPIKDAHVDFDADGRRDRPMRANENEASVSFVLTLRDDRITPEHNSYVLRFIDTEGRENRTPVKHSIHVQPDYAPEAKIVLPREKMLEVRLDEAVPISIEANDPDFQLADVRLRGEVMGRQVLDVALLKKNHSGRFTTRYTFTPKSHGLKAGDVVQYWVVANDNRTPEANSVETGRQMFRVVGGEEQRGGDKERGRGGEEGAQGEQSNGGAEGQAGTDSQAGEQSQDGAESRGGESSGGEASQDNARQGESGEDQRGGEGETGRGGDQGTQGTQPEGGKEQGENQQPSGGENSGGESQGQAGEQNGGEQSKGAASAGGEQDSGNQQQGRGDDQRGGDKERGRGGEEGTQGEQSESGAERGGEEQSQGGGENSQGGERSQGGAQAGGERSPVSSEGDNDGEAFERIQEHLQKNDEMKGDRSESGDVQGGGDDQRGGDKERGRGGEEGAQGEQSASGVEGQAGDKQEGGEKPGEGNQQKGERQAEQSQSSEGQQTATKGESGGGNEKGAQGAPSSQPDGKPGEKPDQRGAEGQQDKKAESPMDGRDKSESDSHGEQGGDRTGGGDEGEGQKSPRDGTGSDGQNQSADKGAGESGEKGSGNKSSNAGSDTHADGKTGESSGDTPGRGTKTRETTEAGEEQTLEKGESNSGQKGERMESQAARAEEGAWEDDQRGGDKERGRGGEEGTQGTQSESGAEGQKGDKSEKGERQQEGTEQQGESGEQSQGGQTGSGGMDATGATGPAGSEALAAGADEANLEYARKQTDLVLDRLSNQLDQKKVDPAMLQKLGWSEDELKRFVDRWKERKAAAELNSTAGEGAKRELDDALRSLGLRPGQLKQQKVKEDSMRDLREGYRGTVPPELRERLKAYNRGVSRAEGSEE